MGMTPSSPTKDELFWQILDAALQLEISKGHLRWKMTDLSRSSGVTRSLIYYYFGNSKIKIIQEAVRIMGEEFFGLSEERMRLWHAEKFSESLQMTRDLVRRTPHIVIFYLQQRRSGSSLSKEIERLEQRYIDKLSKRFPKASREKLLAIFSALLGISALGSELSEDTIRGIVTIITSTLSH